MIEILVDVPLPRPHLQRLKAISGVNVRTTRNSERGQALPERVAKVAEVLVCKYAPSNHDRLGSLKYLQGVTVGYEHLREMNLATRDVRVCNARGVFDSAIGEWCLSMMVNLTRDLRRMLTNQANKRWERSDRFQQEIRGKTVGIWGYGGIGRETARLAKAFGMRVRVLTRSPIGPRKHTYHIDGVGDPRGKLPDESFTSNHEKAFLRGLDFLVLALPRTKVSEGMIGERQLRALPRSALVLNPSRGPIIQESALLKALDEGWIAGAALDTHYEYPLPSNHRLWDYANVVLTPHISGADKSASYPDRLGDLLVQNVERYVAGKPLLNVVSRRELEESSC